MFLRRIGLFVVISISASLLHAEANPHKIEDQLKKLRSVPLDQKAAHILQLAAAIRDLPANSQRVGYADELAHLSTEGDIGQQTLQAVANTLSTALTESPIQPHGDKVPMPYYDLAKMVHYEQTTTTMNDPLYLKSLKKLEENDASLENVDFTLEDIHGKKVKLSELRGKIVLVNFWATWCPPCRAEMQDLDALSQYFAPQGLVVLMITDESGLKVASFIGGAKYSPTILFDTGGKVHHQFHVTGIPNTYLFDRDGRLLEIAIDQRTRRQFLQMLSKTDLHP